MPNTEDIKSKHIGDFKTLWKIYESDAKFYENRVFKFGVLLSFVLFLLSLFSNQTTYFLIQTIATLTLSIIPNLLGFSLGAYILVVGFGGTEILSVITRPLKGQKGFSLYQKLNAVFGMTVLFEIATLLISFVIMYLDRVLPIFTINSCIFLHYLFNIINLIVLFLMIFCIVYSLFLLISVTKQVFIFAQTIHLCVYISEEKKQSRKLEEKSNKIDNGDSESSN